MKKKNILINTEDKNKTDDKVENFLSVISVDGYIITDNDKFYINYDYDIEKIKLIINNLDDTIIFYYHMVVILAIGTYVIMNTLNIANENNLTYLTKAYSELPKSKSLYKIEDFYNILKTSQSSLVGGENKFEEISNSLKELKENNNEILKQFTFEFYKELINKFINIFTSNAVKPDE